MKTPIATVLLLLHIMLKAQPQYPHGEQWYNFTDDGHQQYVFEFGKASRLGDTVIVLHGGWGAEHSYLLDPVAPLADRYRFVLYDQRGSLRSPAPDSTIRLDRLVADMDDLRLSLKLEQVTLVAHSMGNALAYAYLAQHPQRVRGLVLVGPVLPAELKDGPNMEFIQNVWPEADSTALLMDMMSFFEDVGIRTVQRLKKEGMVPDSLMHVPPQELELLSLLDDREWTRAWRIGFTTANTCDNSNWRDMQGGMVFYSQKAANAIIGDSLYQERTLRFWPALQAFQGPVRVIIGTCDYVDLGPSVWPHVVKHLQNGKLQVVQDSGHSIWMDKPQEFTRALDAALKDIQP
jgi:proline iminopeptidase